MRAKAYWAAAIVLLAACNILNNDDAPSGTRTIILYNYFYYPAHDTLTAFEGDTIGVTFLWSDNAVNHSVSWDRPTPTPLSDSEIMALGQFDVTLVPGEYNYHCSTAEGQQASMIGQIIIKPHMTM